MNDEPNAYEAPKHASETPLDTPKKKSRFTCLELFVVVAIVGMLVLFLVPNLRFGGREAARRMQCSTNLKKIAWALHDYHDTYQTFPPAYTADETGKPMHSWRVLLLPFLEQQQLYEQFNFDEPWDGPNNRGLIKQAPPWVYRCPSYPEDKSNAEISKDSLTQYFVVSGSHTTFPGTNAMAFRDIVDGTSNTLMVVECHTRHVAWTAPIDISPEELVQSLIVKDPLSNHPGGFQVALADGSVRFISETIDPQTIRKLSTIDDGEPIPEDF